MHFHCIFLFTEVLFYCNQIHFRSDTFHRPTWWITHIYQWSERIVVMKQLFWIYCYNHRSQVMPVMTSSASEQSRPMVRSQSNRWLCMLFVTCVHRYKPEVRKIYLLLILFSVIARPTSFRTAWISGAVPSRPNWTVAPTTAINQITFSLW